MIDIPQTKDSHSESIENYRFLRFAKPVLTDEDFRDRCFKILENIISFDLEILEHLVYESIDLEYLVILVRTKVYEYFRKNSSSNKISPEVRFRTINVIIRQLEKYIGLGQDDYYNPNISIDEFYKALVISFEGGEVLDGIYDAVGVSKIIIEYISTLRDRHWSIYSNEYPKTFEFLQTQSSNYIGKVNLIQTCIRLLRQEIDFRTNYQKLGYLNDDFLLEIDRGEIFESRIDELFLIHNTLTKFLDRRGTSYDFIWQ